MIRYLLEKEFKLLVRNPIFARVIVTMPIVMMIILPFAANMEVRDINLVVVDEDYSTRSKRLTEKVTSSGNFNLVGIAGNFEEAMSSIDEGTADVILEIPNDFERDLMKGDVQVLITANAVNATKGSIGSTYLSSIVQSFAAETMAEQGIRQEAPLSIVTQNRFNPLLNYHFFMVPALMVMLLTIMCGFLPALNIVWEKETGTIEQMNVTPVKKFTFILSKQIPYWIVGVMAFTIAMIVGWGIFGLTPAGSIGLLYLSIIVFVFTMSAFGLIISNYSNTMQQAMFVMFFFVLILVWLSGLFTPVQSMPEWAKMITIFNPLKYVIQIMRGIYLKGSTFAEIIKPLGVLSCFLVFFVSWAVFSYRKSS